MTETEAFVELTWIEAALVALYQGRNAAPTDSYSLTVYESAIARLRDPAATVGKKLPDISCSEDVLVRRLMCLQWAQRITYGGESPPTN